MKVFGRANGDVWGFIPDNFSKVVGCCVGFYVIVRGCVPVVVCRWWKLFLWQL